MNTSIFFIRSLLGSEIYDEPGTMDDWMRLYAMLRKALLEFGGHQKGRHEGTEAKISRTELVPMMTDKLRPRQQKSVAQRHGIRRLVDWTFLEIRAIF
jgi:hypothetical protein